MSLLARSRGVEQSAEPAARAPDQGGGPLKEHVALESEQALFRRIRGDVVYRLLSGSNAPVRDEQVQFLQHCATLRLRRGAELADRVACFLRELGESDSPVIRIIPRPGYEAFAASSTLDGAVTIGLSAAMVRDFATNEMLFVVGHELGHAVLRHAVTSATIARRLAPLPERHHLRLGALSLSRRQELTADRMGLACCGDIEAAMSAFEKVTTQASALPFRVEMPGTGRDQPLYHFYDAAIDGYEPWLLVHPSTEIRMLALQAAETPIRGLRSGRRRRESIEALREADRSCEMWLDSMEVDCAKADREVVERFYQSVNTIGRQLLAEAAGRPELEFMALELRRKAGNRCCPEADDYGSAVKFLRQRASRGRRIRVLDVLGGLVIAAGKLGCEASGRLNAIARDLEIPPELVIRRLATARARTRPSL